MKKVILASASVLIALGGVATAKKDNPADAVEITQPMKMGDARMTCDQIVAEAGNMELVLGGSPAGGLMDGEHMANIGTGLAQHAALTSGAGGVAAGAIGQVGGLLGRSSKKRKEREAARKAVAEKRWIYMVGLYEGRDCDSQPQASAPAVETESETAPTTE